MGAGTSSLVDLRLQPNSAVFNENIDNDLYVVVNAIYMDDGQILGKPPVQLHSSGVKYFISQLKPILSDPLSGPRTVAFEIQDGSTGTLFVNIMGVWVFMFQVRGKSHPYNGLPVRVNTNLQFLFLVNNQAIRWCYKTYEHAKTVISIRKDLPRGFTADVYTQSIVGVEHFKYRDNDRPGKGSIAPIKIEPASTYVYDWNLHNDIIVK
ncbi:hypothetical protein CYY_005103 [Polysphondylium violaceum]|uniref:Uncharacterized protein n=1 Tax=Polysphondylium violaceum TaxID=133409 RepID=A0A8J4Q424_9MYCE|nr:hypothetical protein CYY_005103 [Polysphondylium violaceum]